LSYEIRCPAAHAFEIWTTRLSEIVHSGRERLGADGPGFRPADAGGWNALVPRFAAAAERQS
jgi:hypothetical protein